MLFLKLVYRRIAYLFIALCLLLLTLIGSVVAQIDTLQPPITNADITEQDQPPPPDDPVQTNQVDSTFLTSRSPQSANQVTAVGGTWTPQGPSPAYNGQVENITNLEVAGAIHTVAAHPISSTILYAGSVNGGIWRTDNATAASPTWVPLTDNKSSLSISAPVRPS